MPMIGYQEVHVAYASVKSRYAETIVSNIIERKINNWK